MLAFADGTKRSVEGILQVFKDFAEISGLCISLEKSTLYIAGVKEDTRDDILHQFPLDSGALPVRYLGLPLLTKRMTTNDYAPLLEKIRSRISSWTARNLSFAGRLQLIGSVIHSLTNFWISAFQLPKACINEIDSLCSAFLWSGPVLNRRKAKIAWSEVCKPREEGGLGLRSVQEANDVCCLKLVWRILSAKSSLWVQWVYCYLIREGSLWSVKETSSLGSWMWKKLLKFRDIAASFVKVEIQDGLSTSFWYDSWSQLGQLITITGQRGRIDLGIPLNASVRQAITNRRGKRHRVEDLNLIEKEIQKLQTRGFNDVEDIRLWRRGGDVYKSKFNSMNTWKLLRGDQPHVAWHKAIWFKHATPKYSVLMWIAVRNRLATGECMSHWNTVVDTSCVFCQAPMETREHLFFQCNYTEEVWRALASNLLASAYTTQWSQILDLTLDTNAEEIDLFLVRYLFQLLIHSIWRERNGRKHGEPATPSAILIKHMDKHMRNRLSSIRIKGDARYDTAMEKWLETR